MSEKTRSLLSALRGAPSPGGGPASPEGVPENSGALAQRIAELERRLQEMQAVSSSAEDPAPGSGDVVQFLETRMALLEKKLEIAQQEALRATVLLREREDAQRKAQREVEDLFRDIREQQRAAQWDRSLREQYSSALARARELEARLALAELRMIPAEDVLRALESEEGRAELERRLRAQLERAAQEAGGPPPEQAPGGEAPEAPPAPPVPPPPLPPLAVVMGRVADLERRLEEAKRERDAERERRKAWERDILQELGSVRSRWRKSGGPEALVEAALESMVDSLRRRDAAAEELSRLAAALRDEPPDSGRTPELKAGLARNQELMKALQEDIDKQMALVQAWMEQGKGTGS